MARLQVHPQRLKLVLSDNTAPIIERLDQAVPVIQCEFSFVLQHPLDAYGADIGDRVKRPKRSHILEFYHIVTVQSIH